MKWYSEQNLIDHVARFTPFFVLAIPATFAYQNVTNVDLLNMPTSIGLLVAVSIEGLGLASVHTSLSLFEHLKQHKQKISAEAVVMLIMTLFYLAVVVMINIVLDLHHEWQIITAKALLSLVSIPAAVTLSIRQLHKSKLEKEAENKAELTARGKLGALTKKYNELQEQSKEQQQANVGLLEQIKQLEAEIKLVKQTVVSKQAKEDSKQTSKRQTKKQQANADILECPDCGKECNGIKGLNGHKAWCKSKQEVELVKANGHVKEWQT